VDVEPTDERYEAARQRVEARVGFFGHLAVFAVVNIVFLIVAGADWLWVTLFWGIGLALHAWRVFFSGSEKLADWKERQIQKELGRVAAEAGSPGTPESGAAESGAAESGAAEAAAGDPGTDDTKA
jgi:hypothetical protein